VDSVLSVMVKGLEEELKERLMGRKNHTANLSPSAQYDETRITTENPDNVTINEMEISHQGMSFKGIGRPLKKIMKWIRK